MRRGCKGFTLLEVLVAFSVFVFALTLVGAAFSRHLHAIGLLESSVVAHRVADQQVLRKLVSRESGAEFAPGGLPEGFTSRVDETKVTLQTEPVKDVVMTRMSGEVSWKQGDQSRSVRVITGVSGQEESADPPKE